MNIDVEKNITDDQREKLKKLDVGITFCACLSALIAVKRVDGWSDEQIINGVLKSTKAMLDEPIEVDI